MAEAFVNVTEGSGKKLHGWDVVIGANTVIDEFVIPGEYPMPTYFAEASGSSIATANDHSLQLMAGASLKLRIRRIRIEQRANVTTAGLCVFEIWRLTSAGTGGTAVTARPFDTADTAGATAMTVPTVKGTESVRLMSTIVTLRQAVSTTGSPADDALFEWAQLPNEKPIVVPAGTTNGLAIKNVTAVAAGSITALIEFVETSF